MIWYESIRFGSNIFVTFHKTEASPCSETLLPYARQFITCLFPRMK